MKATESLTDELTLKTLLSSADITQQELANKIGVSVSLIGFYVARKKTPGLDKAISMARELGVSLKTLARAMGYDVSGIPDDRPLEKRDREKS
jgi:transcriptional regulator with XRE-family HTH domain